MPSTVKNYLRAREIRNYNKNMRDIEEFMVANREVNFRYLI